MGAPSSTGNAAEALSPWRDWLTEHGGKLLLFARQQTRRPEDAEDALQEALVKLAKKVDSGSFVGGQEAWLPFLYTQVRREAIDMGRRNDRRRRREEAVVEDERSAETRQDAWFQSAGCGEEREGMIEEALRDLPPKFAEVITMKIWGDRTFAEIGDVLGISLNTAASRYRYGIEALRKKLTGARLRGDL
jgi:RNA polymerase sigma-70 factor (ECF subfamily)